MKKRKASRMIGLMIAIAVIGLMFPKSIFIQTVYGAEAAPGTLGGPRAESGGENGTELFLGGKYIELGISNWGDFGTLGTKPANFRGTYGGETAGGSNQIGMSADHDGFGTGRDLPIDYYLPGTPEERFAVGYQIGASNSSRSNSAQMGVGQMSTTVQGLSDIEQGLLKAKTVSIWTSTMEVTQIISFATEDKFYRNEVTLKNISNQTWTGARYMRSFDPDNTQFRGGSYSTANTVTHTAAQDGKAVVKAETYSDSDPLYQAFGSRSPIFFYSNDPKAVASVFGFSNANPYEQSAYATPQTKGSTITDDVAITMTWDSGALLPNESKTFVYYTSLDERDFARVQGDIIVADIKKDIEDAEDMDDVKEIKDKIDKEKDLEEEKKKELKTIVVDDICDYPGTKDLPLRDDKDIILVKHLIDESDKTDEEKDDVREKLVDKAMRDIEEPTDVDKDAIDVVANDITDAERKENTKAKIAAALATTSVATAEETKTDDTRTTAQNLVTALPNGEAKIDLQGRLDLIVTTEDQARALAEATTSVTTAEETKTDAAKAAAQELVTALPNVEAKTNLQGRLDLIVTTEDQARALAEATTSVTTAEETKTDAAKAAAQELVTALPNGEAKTNLQSRLDLIVTTEDQARALAEATTSVATAEETKTDVIKSAAQALVTALPEGTDKTDLQNRLDAITTIEDKEKADQAAADGVDSLITALPESGSVAIEDKDQIEEARTAYDGLTEDQKKLVKDVEALEVAEAELSALEELATALQAATKAVATAEEAKTDATKSAAQALVTALPEGTDKTDLQNRLDAITTIEDKEKADQAAADGVDSLITALPEPGSVKIEDKDQIKEARTSYDGLTEDQKALVKDVAALKVAEAELSALEELAAALQAATKAVATAEETKTDATKAAAQALVTTLPEGTDKTDLQNRLDAITTIEDKEKADQVAADGVDSLITSLPESGSVKIEDKEQIEQARAYYDDLTEDQKKLVKDVEALEVAEAELSALEELAAALQAATKAVATAEETKTDATKSAAQALVTALPEGTDKTDLQNRLDAITTIEDKEKTDQAAADGLDSLITALPEPGSVKIEDKDQIEEARTAYDDLTEDQKALVKDVEALEAAEAELSALEELAAALQAATKAVETAEKAKTDTTKAAAQALVTALPEGTDKTDLQNRLDAITTIEDKEKADQTAADGVDSFITSLPESGSVVIEDKGKIEEARTAYDDLTEDQKALVKDVEALEAAEAELSALEELAAALQAAETAEEAKTDATKSAAQALVTALPEGTDKTDLQNRLDAITTIEDKEKADQTATDGVDSFITSLPESGSVVIEDKDQIEDARISYDDLTEEQKKLVTDVEKLEAAEAELSALEELSAALQKATQAVATAEEAKTNTTKAAAQALVTALPEGTDKTDLQNRLEKIITTEDQEKTDQSVADGVDSLITALPEPGSVKIEDKDQIEEARTSYDELTEDQKKLVKDVEALEVAEAELSALEELAAALQAATEAVATAEETKTDAAKTSAQALITALPEGTEKAELQEKLNAIVTEETTELASAKTTGKASLESYVNPADYTTNATNLASAIATGKTNIDAAKTTDEVATALANAKLVIDAIESDIKTIDDAKIVVQDATYLDINQEEETSETAIENAVKATATATVNDKSINVTVNKVNYIAPIAGTSANPDATNGSYEFTVTVSKGEHTQTTEAKTITIIAKPFTGVTDTQAVEMAKTAIVAGTVDVIFGATQEEKIAAVQTYINGLLKDNENGVTATVTHESENDYIISISKGSTEETVTIEMVTNESADPDIAQVNYAKDAVENVVYPDMSQMAGADEAEIANVIIQTAQMVVTDSAITLTLNKVSHTAPIAGTPENPKGTDGSYTFAVIVNKGEQTQTTTQKTITIKAIELIKEPLTLVTISGTARVGETISAAVDPSEATVDYEWKSNGITVGGNSQAYTVQEGDIGKRITVTATGTGIYSGTVISTQTSEIEPKKIPNHTVSGVIKDTNNNPISDATVKVTDKNDPSKTYTDKTDLNGNYTIAVPDGNYTITISKANEKLGNIEITISGEDIIGGNSDITVAAPVIQTYTVAYNANGGNGIIPTDNLFYAKGAYARILSKGNLTRLDYNFTDWNTQIDGKGISYKANDRFVMTANTTLYAQWKRIVSAETPKFTANNVRGTETVVQGTNATQISVTAGVSDGGTLTYQWYENNKNTTIGGTEITGATNESYTPTTDVLGTTYYYVVVTNTLNVDGQTTKTSNICGVKEEIVLAKPAELYNISTITGSVLDYINLSNTSATQYQTYITTLGVESGYKLPTRVIVKIAGRTQVAGDDYNYSKETGNLSVYNVTGQLTIEATGSLIPPKYYTISFDSNGGNMAAAISGIYATPVTLPIPTKTGFIFTGWYQEKGLATSYISPTMGDENITLYAQWKQVVFDIKGNVVDEDHQDIKGATVKLMSGSRKVAEKDTDENGKFTISGVPSGTYNLVIMKDDQTITLVISVSDNNIALGSVTLPKGKKNSVVDVKPNTPDIIVDKLNNFFDSSAFTQDDSNIVDTGGKVEIKLVVEKKDESGDNVAANMENIKAAIESKKTIGMFLDLTVSKIVTPKDNTAEKPILISELDDLLVIEIPLPAQMQGKSEYVIYRYHGSEVQTITQTKNADGEYIELSTDGTTIKLHTKKFSTYAIGYNKTTVTPPASSGDDDEENFDISNKKQIITTEATEGGKVSQDGKTIIITADTGYKIEDVLVDGKSVGPVKTYTFEDTISKHTIKVVFAKEITPEKQEVQEKEKQNPFKDIKQNDWFFNTVLRAYEIGLMVGTSEDTFNPYAGTTRGMIATMIHRLEKEESTNSKKTRFDDVNTDQWYAEGIAWGNEKGIVVGYQDGSFKPDQNITRQELCAIIKRYGTYKGYDMNQSANLIAFSDHEEISSWALESVKWTVGSGIMKGKENKRLDPKGVALRAEVCAMLLNFMDISSK